LVDYALALIKNRIMPLAGCRFVVVDANQPAIEFYKKQGFTLVDTETNRANKCPLMFLDLSKLSPADDDWKPFLTPPDTKLKEKAAAEG
jgi:hypothetical protein